MLDILDFCRLFLSENPEYDALNLNTLDIEIGYSVITKTLEQSFQQIFQQIYGEETIRENFKHVPHEEQLGMLIYLSIVEYLTKMARKFNKLTLNEEKYTVPNDTFNLKLKEMFFPLEKGINLLYDVEYENYEHKSFFKDFINSSLFFTFLFHDEKYKRNDLGDYSYKDCLKLIIRYIFSCELHQMIKRELEKCKQEYGFDRFSISVYEILYRDIEYESLTVFEFCEKMNELFLKKSITKIQNIQYSVDGEAIVDDPSFYHLEFRFVRENMDTEGTKINDRKVACYREKIKHDKKYWHVFNVFQEWIIDLVYLHVSKFSMYELNINTIIKWFLNFFTVTTMRNMLIDFHQKNIEGSINQNVNCEQLRKRTQFPEYFHKISFDSKNILQHEIKQKFLLHFSLRTFDMVSMFSNISYLINTIQLYRFYKDRNASSFDSFPGNNRLDLYFKNQKETIKTVEITKVNVFLRLLHEISFGSRPEKNGFLENFRLQLSKHFQHFFPRNVKKKMNRFWTRIQFIRNDYKWILKDGHQSKIYSYFCHDCPLLFDQLVKEEHAKMKLYMIPSLEELGEKVRASIFDFVEMVGENEDTIRNHFQFMMEFLFGIEIEIWDESIVTKEDCLSFSLKEMETIIKEYNLYNYSIDEAFFEKYYSIQKVIVFNFPKFVKLIKKIELVYFEESENKHEIEKVAHCRVKALGNENIIQMMDQENISS